MKDDILINLNNPDQLEKLYRENKTVFKREFNLIYPEISENLIAKTWEARLNFKSDEISHGKSSDLVFVIILTFLAGLVAKIPDIAGIAREHFYMRNISFIVFPFLAAYFFRNRKLRMKKIIIVFSVFIISAIYINILPGDDKNNTLLLACIHLPLFLWTILGYVFSGGELDNYNGRIDYLKYNGDLIVMTTIMMIAGGLLTGVTFGLFRLIDINVQEIFSNYILVWGLAAVPVTGTYLVRTNPQLVNKVSPVIAKIFTPLVLVTLVIYLSAVIYTGKDPYNDREFLLVFNALLIGVMAIILFSVTETSKNSGSKTGVIMLFMLSTVTIILNCIALSAIVFRISEWGITPNRLAVLGGNLLILMNLLLVTFRLYKAVKSNTETGKVELSIAGFLLVYGLWALVVIFLFPVMFSFR